MTFKKTFSDWLKHRYQLVIRNEETLAEQSTFRFGYAKLIFLGTVLFGILVSCSLVLANTFLARWLNPAYIAQENKEKIIKLATEVDTLEKQATQQKNFITLLQCIIAGKEPPTNALPTNEKNQAEKIRPYSPAQLATANTLLQREFEEGKSSLSATSSKPTHDLQTFFLFPPINGIVTSPFKRHTGHYGVDIVAKERAPIKCVADGVVIFSAWTVETGWVMVIQHKKDLISVYKHNATLLKKVSNFVKAGEVIASMGNSGKLSTGPHLHFELWYEGKAVNPEHFITF